MYSITWCNGMRFTLPSESSCIDGTAASLKKVSWEPKAFNGSIPKEYTLKKWKYVLPKMSAWAYLVGKTHSGPFANKEKHWRAFKSAPLASKRALGATSPGQPVSFVCSKWQTPESDCCSKGSLRCMWCMCVHWRKSSWAQRTRLVAATLDGKSELRARTNLRL